MKPDLSVIIPCYNENKNIPEIIGRLEGLFGKYNYELILVDNGSTDGSAKTLEDLAGNRPFIKVVTINKNIGYGNGIFQGLKNAEADILCYTHADIQTPPEDVFKAFDYLKENRLDPDTVIIKGLRINRPPEKNFLTRNLSKITEMILGYKLDDINGQPKLFSKSFLLDLKFPPLDFAFDVYVMYMAKTSGRQIHTFPVDFGQRRWGQSKWATTMLGKYKTIAQYLRSILMIAVRHYDMPCNGLKQLVRFLVTGALASGINYAIFFGLLRFGSINYLISSAIGFFSGAILSFFMNRSWTFSVIDDSGIRLFKSIILNLISLAANLLTIWFVSDILHVIPEISQVAAIVVSAATNFIGLKTWVFKQKGVN